MAKNQAEQPSSRQVPTIGRIVHVFSDLWAGPRPGIITAVFGTSPDSEFNVQAFLDGCNDKAVACNHFTSIQIHDGDGEAPETYAVWPPHA